MEVMKGIEQKQKELTERSMEWIPLHENNIPRDEWVIVKLKTGIRRYVFARWSCGHGWYDDNNHSIRDDIECYAILKDRIIN